MSSQGSVVFPLFFPPHSHLLLAGDRSRLCLDYPSYTSFAHSSRFTNCSFSLFCESILFMMHFTVSGSCQYVFTLNTSAYLSLAKLQFIGISPLFISFKIKVTCCKIHESQVYHRIHFHKCIHLSEANP